MDTFGSESILDAATNGNMSFLKKAYEDNVGDLRSYFLGREDTNCWNLLHAAVECDQYKFLYKALNFLSLHPALLIELLCQPESRTGCNPFHIAAGVGNIFTVKLLVNAYARAVVADANNQETTPWSKKDFRNNTPLRRCFLTERRSNEVLAKYLVSLDQSLLTSVGKAKYPKEHCSTLILDNQQTSIVFNAMETGCSLLVEQILISDLPYSVNGNTSGETPLHHASKCTEQVARLLLEKHPELIRSVTRFGETVLDRAVKDGATWLVKLMLIEEDGVRNTDEYEPPPWIKACRRLIFHRNVDGNTPLHIAARKGYTDIAKFVIRGYESAIQDEAAEWDEEVALPEDDNFLGANPVYLKNYDGHTPLVVSLTNRHDDCAVMLSKETFPLTTNYVVSGLHWEALIAAQKNGCRQSVKTILAIIVTPGSTKSEIAFDGHVILAPGALKIFTCLFEKYQAMSDNLTSEEMEKLSEVLPKLLKVEDVNTLLKEAAESGEDWLVTLFLESDKDSILECQPAWQIACEKGLISTLFTFINMFGHQEFVKHCQDIKQTPLHHIKLEKYGEYFELLKMPAMELLKNQVDCDGATPLHRAIQRDDLQLTKALLEIKGIAVYIKDKNGTTAFDLLENRCKFSKSWSKMCREVEQDSTVQNLKYLFRKISCEGMQSTLSLVAALVAIITYATGFTVPGGFDSIDGTPMLVTKPAFLVFYISNTIAMCSSIMVLVLLLGPMMWNPRPSLCYFNSSLFLLLLSLGGTLLAFMTGIYATMVPKIEWNAIVVIASCSLTLLVACFVLLLNYSPRFKNLVHSSFHWMSGNQITQANKALDKTSSMPPVEPQPANSNTSQKSAGPSDIQLMTNVPTSDEQSGSTMTMLTQPYGIALTAAPELGQKQADNPNWETGQSSHIAPDTKIDITST